MPPVQRPALPPAEYDYGRLVRVWESPTPEDLAKEATNATPVGSRIVFASNVPAPSDLALLASAGFTLLQTDSDHQSTEETRPGAWDYAGPDRARALALGAGFDWCYFPHFAFPPRWYADKIAFPRIRCLEHDQTVEAFSPWDPNFGYFLNRGYEVLARHYSARGAKPALYLGVHGDYGECGLFIGARTAVAGQKEQWQQRFGNLHNHVGWWCGDPLARAAFRTAMLARYGSVEAVNRAWRTDYADAEAIAYPPGPGSASRRHWLDWVNWYRDSVSALTDTVCRVARRHFPDALLILPVGFANEDPRNGADNSMLAKVAARHRVHLRSTHGGFRPFAENQAGMLGRLASACRFYGAPLWTEPPSAIEPDAQTARAFETISLGARGHFDWASNVSTGRDAYYRNSKHMRVARRVTDVAMFFPTTSHLLKPDDGYPQTLLRGTSAIRDGVLDGALDRYRVLVWWEGAVVEATVLERIRAWIQRGGALVAYDFGKVETVEGATDWFRDVLGYAGKGAAGSGALRFVLAPGTRMPQAYRISVGEVRSAQFLEGDWYPAETTDGVTRRWTGEVADLRLPAPAQREAAATSQREAAATSQREAAATSQREAAATSQREAAATGDGDLTVSVRASFPPEAAGLRREVLVNGTQVGIMDLAGEHTYRFAVPASVIGGRSVLRVSLRCKPFVPATSLKGSLDQRRLGIWVTHVEIQSEASRSTVSDAPPSGRFEVGIDLRRLRSEWARPYGRGWTVYFPARRDQLPAFCEVVRYVVYHLSDLDPSKADALAIDNAWDGMYATLCTDRAIYYNGADTKALRTIVLSPSAFSATPEVRKPASFMHELTLDPHSLAVIPGDKPHEEMLLQCERFTMLGALEPLEGPSFSPATGQTHVLIPEQGEIGTRFECPAAGTYFVHYRTTRRGAMARAQLLVDGRPCRTVPSVREHRSAGVSPARADRSAGVSPATK
ncbi:MAG: hypothetical protein FJX72_14465, partial [Armatimonadetes bacterium]|nr:hypothetical protein [Armatimonadota bacterium]